MLGIYLLRIRHRRPSSRCRCSRIYARLMVPYADLTILHEMCGRQRSNRACLK